MSDIISYKCHWRQGKVPLESLQKIWEQYKFSTSVQRTIINILEKFEIIYCSYKKTETSEQEKKKTLENLE